MILPHGTHILEETLMEQENRPDGLNRLNCPVRIFLTGKSEIDQLTRPVNPGMVTYFRKAVSQPKSGMARSIAGAVGEGKSGELAPQKPAVPAV
jgi:hypothetical protein